MGNKTKFEVYFLGFGLSLVLLSGYPGFAASPNLAHSPLPADAIPGATVKLSPTVWVAKPDGAQSCSADSGLSLDSGAAELRKAKIQVLNARKGNDPKMRTQMCGAPKGSTNSFQIPEKNLADAMALGYQQLKTK
jgi:hypothetical protein